MSTSNAPAGGLVLVTGSGGFLGRALIERLLDRYAVVGLDAVAPLTASSRYETIRTDLTSDASVHAALQRVREVYGRRIAAVIHLAAYYDLSGEDDPKYEAVTVQGTARLLRELQPFEVERLVFSSTLLVHAPTRPGRPIDESSPLAPSWAYPASKARTEELILARRGEMPVAILRLAGIYDGTCHAAFLARQIANIFERSPIAGLYPGDVDRGQPYLHIEDFVDIILRLVERRHRLPSELTLMVGEPETPSYDELQRQISQLLHGEAIETREVPKPLAQAGAWLQDDVLDHDPFVQGWMIDQAGAHFELDISRAQRLLDWRPRHRLADTIPEIVSRLKADPPGWYAANKLDPHIVAEANVDETARRADAVRDRAALARDHARRLEAEHERSAWVHLVIAALGFWLMVSPFMLGLFDPLPADLPPPPALGHDLPDAYFRNAALAWNAILGGFALICLGLLAQARFRWAPWGTVVVGCWLMFAPLVAWTPNAAALTNDQLVGFLVVAFAVIVARPPGIAPAALAADDDIPVGWSYNPSTYVQRVPIVAMALIGLFVSRHLTAYQLGHIDRAWDPFFGDGTMEIITSSVSKAWPVPDAGVGLVTYMLEVLAGLMGDRRRWRTMPWLTLLFGLMIVPLGAVSIFFIVIQPVWLGTWCSLCLIAAAAMVLMIPYSLDELVAVIQFLAQSRRAGRPFWRTLFRGDAPTAVVGRDDAPGLGALLATQIMAFIRGGVTYPVTLVAATLVGVWLMLTQLTLGAEGAMANSDHLVGCLVITLAVTAYAELSRAVRFLILPLAAWLLVAPFLLAGATFTGTIASIITGLLLVALILPRGRLSGEHYAGWDRWVI